MLKRKRQKAIASFPPVGPCVLGVCQPWLLPGRAIWMHLWSYTRAVNVDKLSKFLVGRPGAFDLGSLAYVCPIWA